MSADVIGPTSASMRPGRLLSVAFAANTAWPRSCVLSPKRSCASRRADRESTSRYCILVPPLTATGCRDELARPRPGLPGYAALLLTGEAAISQEHRLSSQASTSPRGDLALATPRRATLERPGPRARRRLSRNYKRGLCAGRQ